MTMNLLILFRTLRDLSALIEQANHMAGPCKRWSLAFTNRFFIVSCVYASLRLRRWCSDCRSLCRSMSRQRRSLRPLPWQVCCELSSSACSETPERSRTRSRPSRQL